jgi:hypothetical protein
MHFWDSSAFLQEHGGGRSVKFLLLLGMLFVCFFLDATTFIFSEQRTMRLYLHVVLVAWLPFLGAWLESDF